MAISPLVSERPFFRSLIPFPSSNFQGGSRRAYFWHYCAYYWRKPLLPAALFFMQTSRTAAEIVDMTSALMVSSPIDKYCSTAR
jgi:hypothetical protein